MKKKLMKILSLSLCLPFTLVASAATSSWNYSDYNYGSYVPKTGSMTSSYATGIAYTRTDFTFDSSNVTAIKGYNNGTNSSYPGTYGYVTIDVTSVRSGSLNSDMMHAYAMASNLPNPKFDMENDDLLGTRNEESEVVVLGTVSAQAYYVKTTWEDFRSGGSSDNGKWQCQFAMSKEGVNDYNNFITSSVVQAVINYGKNAGSD